MTEAAYDIQVHLERWRDNAQRAVDTFAALRQKTEESSRRLESPPGGGTRVTTELPLANGET